MFGLMEDATSFSLPLFALQQVFVPLLAVGGTAGLAALIDAYLFGSRWPESAAALLLYLTPAALGWLLGRVARRMSPGFRVAGRWVWVAPVGLLLVSVVSGLLRNSAEALREVFYLNGGESNHGLGALLITFPALASCFYAVSIGLNKKPGQR